MELSRLRLVLTIAVFGAATLGAAAPAGPIMLAHPASPNAAEKHAGWERVQVNRACEGCHVEIAAEWRESRHRLAYTNGPFQRSLEREAPPIRPFCQGCHAPETNPLVPPSNLVADMGIGCVTCHAPQGPVLAAKGSSSAPHAVLRTNALTTEAACANCHEFLFPGLAGLSGLQMQRTIGEHTANTQGKTCSDCHMPVERGAKPHKSHRFPGGYDEALVKSALDVRVTRVDEKKIRVVLVPKNISHAFPTGDLFRRLAVEVFPDEGEAKAGETRYLARHFRRARRMHEIDDDRVFRNERVLDFDVSAGAVRIRVRYERVGHHRGPDEQGAVVESSVLMAELRLPAEGFSAP